MTLAEGLSRLRIARILVHLEGMRLRFVPKRAQTTAFFWLALIHFANSGNGRGYLGSAGSPSPAGIVSSPAGLFVECDWVPHMPITFCSRRFIDSIYVRLPGGCSRDGYDEARSCDVLILHGSVLENCCRAAHRNPRSSGCTEARVLFGLTLTCVDREVTGPRFVLHCFGRNHCLLVALWLTTRKRYSGVCR